MKGLPKNPVRINDVGNFLVKGPWPTKSGGLLNVLFALPVLEIRNRFFQYDEKELDRIPVDIRGLRVYTVRGLPKGGIGGGEFHRVRSEIIICLAGRVIFGLEDLFGGKLIFPLNATTNVMYIPPFILHTYCTAEENSSLLVIANTLFEPDIPQTHDTYSEEEFRRIQIALR